MYPLKTTNTKKTSFMFKNFGNYRIFLNKKRQAYMTILATNLNAKITFYDRTK